MYENITYEQILGRILDRVPKDIDKREGSIIYDAVSPLAVEIFLFYNHLECLLNDTYADTASDNYLLKRCEERGIFRKLATKARVKAIFTPEDINLLSKRFNCGGIYFRAIEEISQGIYILECETAGIPGNISTGLIIPVENISGLETAEIIGISSHGEPDEDINTLRSRYFDSLKAQAFAGNIADYKEKASQVPGVYGVKVYPAFSGGGTVKLVISNSNYKKPSTEILESVKNIFDPENGNGAGLAPIGHKVSVFGVNERLIDISFDYVLESGISCNDLLPFFTKIIDGYFCELSENWSYREQLVVRASQLEARLLELTGILDISNLTINGDLRNLVLSDDEIPVRGDING